MGNVGSENVDSKSTVLEETSRSTSMAGYIQKDGKGKLTGKGFRTVYLEVGDKVLKWYKGKPQTAEDAPKCEIHLKGYKVCARPVTEHDCGFDLVHHHRDNRNVSFKVFSDDSEYTRTAWMQRINDEIADANKAARTRSDKKMTALLRELESQLRQDFRRVNMNITEPIFNEALRRLHDMHKSFPSLHNSHLGKRLFDLWKIPSRMGDKEYVVEWYRFKEGVITIDTGTTEELVSQTFDVYDVDGSGSISRDEFVQCLAHVWTAAFAKLSLIDTSVDASEVKSLASQNISTLKQAASKSFDGLKNGRSGALTYEEFFVWAINGEVISARSPSANVTAETTLARRVRALSEEEDVSFSKPWPRVNRTTTERMKKLFNVYIFLGVDNLSFVNRHNKVQKL